MLSRKSNEIERGKWGRKLEGHSGEDIDVLRSSIDFSGIHKLRNPRANVSRRVSSGWLGTLWYFHCTVGRQEVIQLKIPVGLKIHPQAGVLEMKIREWAAKNSYTLIAMSILFAITWAIIIGMNVWAVAHGK